jgi:hypothetical protein
VIAGSKVVLADSRCHGFELTADSSVFAVSRIQAQSQTYNLELTLDMNTEIYPMKVFDKFSLALTQRLRKDGEPDDGVYDQSGEILESCSLCCCEKLSLLRPGSVVKSSGQIATVQCAMVTAPFLCSRLPPRDTRAH